MALTALSMALQTLVSLALVAQPVSEQRWLAIETAHFDVFGNLPADELRRHAEILEVLHAALQQLNPDRAISSPTPPRVLLLSSAEWFARYAPARSMKDFQEHRADELHHEISHLSSFIVFISLVSIISVHLRTSPYIAVRFHHSGRRTRTPRG